MKARKIEDGMYEVVSGTRWYTAAPKPDGSYFVVNHLGRVINVDSSTYRRVVKAVQLLPVRVIHHPDWETK